MLVAYYCPEPLSRAAQRFLRRAQDPTVSDLVEVEFFSALARKVRGGQITRDDAQRITGLFVTHLESGGFARMPLERSTYHTARAWLEGLAVPVRTLDALHLAVAATHEMTIATSDAALAASAAALGIRAHRIGLKRRRPI